MDKKSRISLEYILISLFVLAATIIGIFGYLSYRYYESHFQTDIELQLAAVSEIKSNEILRYFAERISNGNVLFRRDSFYNAVKRLFENPQDRENEEYLRAWLGRYVANYGYDNIFILDSSGAVRMSVPDSKEKVSSVIVGRLPQIMQADQVQVGDFYRNEHDNLIHIPLFVPITGESKSSRPIGMLLMRIDPETYLYPFISKWPVPSRTAETLLVRKDGDDVLFLNNLRFTENSALNLRIPIDKNKDVLAVKAVLGQIGPVKGLDYRGARVVGYLRHMPGLSWFFVTRVDEDEVYGPMRLQLLSLAALIIASIVLMAAALWLVWRRRRVLFYQAQYEYAMKLKNSEESYRNIFESANDAILIRDPETYLIVDVNKKALELFHYSKEEMVGGGLDKILTKSEKYSVEKLKLLYNKISAEGPQVFEWPVKDRSGREIWVEASIKKTTIGGQERFMAILRDITERKRLEKELSDVKEKQYRTLIENMPQKVFLKDRNSVYIFCNENYAKDLNVSPENIAGRTDYDFFPTQLADKYRADDKRIMDAGDVENIEEEYLVIKDFLRGSNRAFINTIKVPVKDKDGNVTGIFGLFWDITEKKEAAMEREKALRWQRDLTSLRHSLLASATLESKLKLITDGIVNIFGVDFCRTWLIKPGDMCDKGCIHAEVKEGPHVCRNRNKCLHLLASSGRYTHIDGKEHARVPFGCYKIGLIASGDEQKFLTNDVVNDSRVHNHEWARKLGLVSFAGYQLRIPGGETLGVLALFAKHNITPIEDAILDGLGVTTGFIVQQSAVEEERRLMVEAKASADVRSKFTSIVSHELRSPLSVIKESINLVLEGLVGDVNDEQKEVLATAKNNTDRLSRLINNVLDFQKIEAGKMDMDTRECDINSLVLETGKAINILATEKGLGFTVDLEENMPAIKADKDRIVQVITNLLSNAIKFTEKGNISISTRKDGNMVHIAVEDSGVGIKPGDIDKLFRTFEQLGDRQARKIGGTGLGLAISKEIVLAHNGKIWAESNPGKGSIFHFTLPIKERRI